MLAATLSRGGSYQRLGPDEKDAIHRPIDISWGTTMPGGFAEGSIRLPFSDLDLWLLADVRVYDSDGETAYQGRVEGVDREGDTISLNLAGWWAHAADDATARALIIDRDLGHWGEPSLQRQINTVAMLRGDTSMASGAEAGIFHQFPEVDNARDTIAEAWYDAGMPIGAIRYDFDASGSPSATWIDAMGLSADETFAVSLLGTDHNKTDATNQTLSAGGDDGYTFAKTTAFFPLGNGSSTVSQYHAFKNVAVEGFHGLTERGTWPDIGYYGSEVIAYLLNSFAPGLSTDSVDIEESTLELLHLAWLDETTAQAMISEVAPLSFRGSDVPDYGVYEDKRFFLKAPGWGRTWRVRLDQGVSFDDEGIDSAEVCNGAVVVYSGAAGTNLRVGPVGSGADDEDDVLADTDPANAVNAAGIDRKWIPVNAGMTTLAGATTIGQVAMRQANSLGRRGEVKLSEIIPDDHGILFPSHLVRAGDMLAIEDDEVVVTYPVRSMNRSADGSVSAAIGVDPDRVSVLLARLGVNQSVLNF